MQQLKVNHTLRLRSYEYGYVLEKKDKEGWKGVSWYSDIIPAITGTSNYLVKHSRKDLPQALKDAAHWLVRQRNEVKEILKNG